MTRTVRRTFGMAGLLGILILVPASGESADPVVEKQLAEMRQKISALEARLKALEGAVRVSGGSVKILSGGALTLQGGGLVDIKGSALALQGSGVVDIKGAMIKLNGGGKPLARHGDRVTVQTTTGAAVGTIIEGSPTVLGQ